MPNDNLKKYYSYLKSNGADVAPTYEAFANALSDENNAKKYHSYLLKNGFDAPKSYDVFSQKLGIVKKKETTVSPSVQKPKPISSGTQPKVTQKPSGTSVSQNKIEVFTNFPGKEDNEYRIVNNNWQRKEPGKDWTTVRDSNAIIGLNKQYKKNIVPVEGFEGISGKLIGNSEGAVVPYLQRNYGRLGFNFEKTGAGDRVRVVTQDGKNSEVFMLDNWTDEGDSSEAVRLKAWLKENINTIDRERYNKVDDEISAIKNITPKQRESLKSDAFSNMSAELPAELALDINQQLKLKEKEKEAMQYNKSRMDALMTDINKAKQTKGKEDDAEVRARVAAVYGNKDEIAKQNRYISNSLNDIARVSTDLNRKAKEYDAEVTRWQADLAKNNGIETPELAERKLALQGRAEMLNSEATALDDNLKLSKSYQTKLDDIAGEYMLHKQGKGSTGGAMINNFIEGATNIWRFAGLERSSQEELIKLIGSDYTTKEYATSEERSDIEKVLFSLSNSIGAVVGGAGVGTTSSFFAQSYYDVKDEIDDNPDFNGVPELEKTLVASTIGLTVGWLEKFGLDKIMSKNPISKSIINRILLKTVGDLPKDATAEILEQAINTNVKALLAKGAINIAGGALVEGSTEFAQEFAEGSIKKLYNVMKGKKMFEEPESLLSQSFEAAYLGAMGGAIMQSPIQATKAIVDGISNNNKLAIEILEKSVTDAELRSMMVTKIKTQIVNGELTKEEGQKQIDAVNEVANTFDKLPDNITDEDRNKSFDLLIERSKIEKEIAGKDENLVAVQRARIAEINNELKTISENAVKESTKPVKEGPAEGGGVQYQGTQEGQPEVRETERPVGQAAQPSPDLGNRAVEGRGVQEETRVTRQVVNRPAVLSEFGGKTFDTPLKGDVYVEGQQVVFEDRSTGRVYELGNVDEVMDTQVPGLSVEQERVSITPEGKVSIEGGNWNIQSELPTQGIEYNPAGEVMTVSLKDDAGNTKMFKGQDAVDIAYQIELQKYQTEEQQQFINDLLEQDEEFQAATENIKPAEVAAVVQEEAAPDIIPTEPTAVEETIVEQPIAEEAAVAEEVERLGRLIEGTDEQIDEQLGKLRISKDNNKVAQSIANAAKSIAKILPDVKFVVHDTDESYRKATGEQNRKQSTAGEYNPKTRTIHINGTKANNRTAAHEVFHAILLNKIGSDIEAQRLTKAMINSVMKSLVQVEGSPKIISYLNDFASNYEKNIQNEEKLAELFGILADGYNSLPYPSKNIIRRFLDRMAKLFGLKPFTDAEVIQFMNNVSFSVEAGEEITVKDIKLFGPKEQGDGGEVGTFSIPRQQKESKVIKAPSVKNDERSFIRNIVQDVDIREFNGKPFITNMYDYTNAGETNLGNGLTINLFGGKGYVPYMMELKGNNIGQVSNLAAFNTKAQAETFIRNSINGNANLFAPHSGTLDQSWQFQQHMFAELVDLILKNNILSNSELIQLFNNTIKSNEKTIKAFNAFKNKYGEDINNFDSFESNPNEIVRLLDIENNFSPDLRKAFNNAIPANKKFKEALGINNKDQFYKKIMDPLNDGVEGGEIMSIVQFDPNTFEIVQTKPGDIDHHPSFGWTLLAKIDGVYQPTEFYKSYDVTDTYTKYNKDKTEISRKTEQEKFAQKNVMSSAGAIPKIAELKSIRKQIDNSFEARNQKPTGVENIIFTARNNGFSDAAIREYLKQKNGLSDKEATDAINKYNIKEEDIWVPSEGKLSERIKTSLQSFRKKFFSARSFLPKSVFAYKEEKEASVASHLNIVDQNVTDFNRLYNSYKGDKDKLIKDFDAYIRGDKAVELPEEFKIVANSMRNQIDGLSQQLIDNGLVDADMAQTIKDNLGQYLTRSYRVYDRENWKNEVQEEVKQQALNFLRAQYRPMAEDMAAIENMPVEEALDNLVNNKLNEMLDKAGATNFIKGSRLGSKDLSVLKERQDIPFEIRALMGEYADPALNYARTILKMSSLAANHNFLTQVKEAGMGKYFFEKNDPRRGKEFNTQIATEGSEAMNPLNGLYTTKEIAEAFQAQSNELGVLMQNFMKLQSGVRWAKTIGSIGTHFKNVIGNLGFVWINAHYGNIGKAYSVVKNDLSKSNNQQKRDMMNNYIKLGIVKQSAGLGEIMDMFKDANFDIAMASRLSNQKIGLLGKAKRVFFKGKKFAEDMYQAEDDFFKIVAYENELERYSKALFGKSKNELTEQELKEVNKVVTEIVKNTYPTYDRIPNAIKLIRRVPFVGNFISFQAEAYRTAFNTAALAKEELSSKNPEIKKIGAMRLAGATTYISAKTAILQYFGMAAGTGLTGAIGYLFDDDDEEEKDKDIREFVAPWSKESDLIIIQAGNGKLKYIDFSATDPHGAMKKAINAFLLGESTTDSFIDGMLGVVQPFVGEEMTTEAILALKNNRDKYGKEIWNPEDSDFEKVKAITNEIYKLVEPGTISSIRRGVASEDKGQELVANLTGFRTYDVDLSKQFGFKTRDYSERIKNAKRIYNSAFYNEKATDKEKKDAYNKANDALKLIYGELINVYNSAERLGVKSEDLENSMKEFGNMSKADILKIKAGETPELKSKEEEEVIQKEIKM